MAIKIKAGTVFVLPVNIEDDDFELIEAVEFLFKQDEAGETLKTAYWNRNGENRDASLVEGEPTFLVRFSRDDSYLFTQEEMFFLDTRIHYENSDINPYTPLVRVRMNQTLFVKGEEVQA